MAEETFGGIGYIQVRVLTHSSGREIYLEVTKQIIFDLTSLQANPNHVSIQPLSFSPVYGIGGTMTLTPAISRSPLVGTFLLTAVLSAKYIDWEVFFVLEHPF